MFFRQVVSVKQFNGLLIASGRRFLSKGFTTGTFNKPALRGQRSNYSAYNSWIQGQQAFRKQTDIRGFIWHDTIKYICKMSL